MVSVVKGKVVNQYHLEGIYVADSSMSVAEDILSKLREQHPEHLHAHATVTISFIKDVNTAWNSTIGIGSEIYMSEHLAKEIYQRLAEDVIAKPMEVRTIDLICELYDEIGFEHFLGEGADAECSTSWQFNNRANSRSALSRYFEALEDYNYACEIEPKCLMYLLNRARTFIALDMRELALRDAMHAYAQAENKRFGTKDDFMTIDDFVEIAGLMIICGHEEKALEALLKFTSAFKRYLPFLSRIDDDGFCSMSLDGHSSRINIGFFLDHALAVFHSIREGNNCVVPTRLDILTELLDLTNKIGHTNAPPPAGAGVSYRIL